MKKIVPLMVVFAIVTFAGIGFVTASFAAPASEESSKDDTKCDQVKSKKAKHSARSNHRYHSKWIYADDGYSPFRYRWCRDNHYPYDYYTCDYQAVRSDYYYDYDYDYDYGYGSSYYGAGYYSDYDYPYNGSYFYRY